MGGGFSVFSSHLSKAGASSACPEDLCVMLCVTQCQREGFECCQTAKQLFCRNS